MVGYWVGLMGRCWALLKVDYSGRLMADSMDKKKAVRMESSSADPRDTHLVDLTADSMEHSTVDWKEYS